VAVLLFGCASACDADSYCPAGVEAGDGAADAADRSEAAPDLSENDDRSLQESDAEASSRSRCEGEPTPALVLLHGTVIDGTGASPLADAALVLLGNRILEVGPVDAVTICSFDEAIDVAGSTILPGIIDAHVHQGFSAVNLERWVQAGVTTVRDLGTDNEPSWSLWMDGVLASGIITTPAPFAARDGALDASRYARVVGAGPMVTVAGGYPIYAWGDGLALTVSSPADAALRTLVLLAAGADLIKIGFTDAATRPELSPEQTAAILEAAQRLGRPVSAHVTASDDLAMCVAAGLDDAAHVPLDPMSPELIAAMVERDVYLLPTLSMWRFYMGEGERWLAALDNVRRFVAAGGKVALGDDYSDYGNGQILGIPIADIEWLLAAGMTSMQIVVAGTAHAAHVCHRSHDLGTLEPGKLADLLVVGGDPLADLHLLQTGLRFVIKNGVIVRRP
jgi:imidazolonepropionase-like amidohydrolase